MLPLSRLDRWATRAAGIGLLTVSLAMPRPAPAVAPAAADDVGKLALIGAAGVTWPLSSLLVSEVVTGGASASDEFVEIYNAGPSTVDLGALELVYVTASGGTVSRKQAWTEAVLQPGRHLLLANSAGSWAATADGLYTGGFAATGGTVALRSIGGAVVDSLSWGDAASAFVEGRPGIAPPAGASLERLPGGILGNGIDTNDNLLDSRIEHAPVAHNLAAAPVPPPLNTPSPPPAAGPSSAPEPTLLPDPTLPPDPTPLTDPTLAPDPTPDPDPTLPPEPTVVPGETDSPTATPTVTIDTPTPTPTPTPTASPALMITPSPTASAAPTATPAPTATAPPTASAPPTATPLPTATPPLPISQSRMLPVGTAVTVSGTLTTPLGLTESGKGAFVQDGSAGIALYLAAGDWPLLPAGTSVTATGVLETRFSLLTVRLASAAALTAGAVVAEPQPLPQLTGGVSEDLEGLLITVSGVISESAASLSDGFSTAVDDGSGALRVVVAGAAAIDASSLARGTRVALVGVVGQRDSSGTGSAGYRLHLRSAADILALPDPTPSASPSPTPTPTPAAPTPTPAPTSQPTPAPTAAPTATPQPSITPTAVATARELGIGVQVTVRGVVTVAPGRILGDATIAIQDGTAGIFVRLPAEHVPGIVPGRVLEVAGTLAAPYGNLELRPASGGVRVVGQEPVPAARSILVAAMSEATEGLLARITATVRRIDASATSLTLIVEDDSGEGRVFIHRPVGLERSHFSVGQRLEVTGVVGDRSGLYRLWPRDPSDVRRVSGPASPTPAPTSSPHPTAPGGGGGGGGGAGASPGPSAPAGERVISIANALRADGQQVTIEGSVTAAPGLLDSDGRRITVEDQSAAVLVRLPAGTPAPAVGQRLRVTGKMGTYFGAPQLATDDPPVRSGTATVAAQQLARAPIGGALEWRLVTLTGDVVSVNRDGEAWRAEIAITGGTVPIAGLARSGIPADALVTGRRATIRGIVKRAHPSARDQRYAVVPRSTTDVALGGAAGSGTTPTDAVPGDNPNGGVTAGNPDGSPAAQGGPTGEAAEPGPSLAALGDITAHEGRTVRVGGRIESITGASFVLRDGSSVARVRLAGEAAALAADLRPHSLVNVVGRVERSMDGGTVIVVTDPTGVHVLAPFGAQPTPVPSAPTATAPAADAAYAGTGTDDSPTAATGDEMVLLAGLLAAVGSGVAVEAGRRARRLWLARRSAAVVAARLAQLPPP